MNGSFRALADARKLLFGEFEFICFFLPAADMMVGAGAGRTNVADITVPLFSAVEALDVIEHIRSCFVPGEIFNPFGWFSF